VVDGQELLRELKAGDAIPSMKVVDGAEDLVNSSRDSLSASESST